MAVSFAQLRAAIATQIDALAGFNLLSLPPNYVGRTQKTKAHLGFSVGVDSSSETSERQRRIDDGYYLNSTVTVKFLYRLRPLDLYPTDYDNCLDKEELVIGAVLQSYNSIQSGIQIRYNSSIREISNPLEFMIVTLTFNILHSI
tara:strand:+ start:1106 stop:1540 length:435 start_codon:yes stop_codon:yes gene_type:complete